MMNNNKQLFKAGKILLTISTVFWFAETWYFGFNMLPQSDSEKVADGLVVMAMLGGLVMMFYAGCCELGDKLIAAINYLNHNHNHPLNFWPRLKDFVHNVQVHDMMSDEEKQMIIDVCDEHIKNTPTP